MAERFGDFLIKRGVIGPEQLQEAETVAKSRRLKLQDAIVQLGYANGEQIAKALAKLRHPMRSQRLKEFLEEE